MGFILSCATTPLRIDNLIITINQLKCKYKYFVINVCQEYKRFGKFKIPKQLLLLKQSNKRVIINFVDDYGPVCKYIGGFNFMKKNSYLDDHLIIIDDDICYSKELFYELMDSKTTTNITTGSGFTYSLEQDYISQVGSAKMVEGYAGICFNYDDSNDFILWYSNFYRFLNFKDDSDSIINKYLCASFLGDDFIISYMYQDKYAIKNGRSYINPLTYGLQEDALQNNTIFGGNIGSYKFLNNNIIILDTFKNKYLLNKQINYQEI